MPSIHIINERDLEKRIVGDDIIHQFWLAYTDPNSGVFKKKIV